MIIKRKDSFLFFKPLKAKKLKTTITSLGASFIKLAQVLATRSDFFDKEYLEELKELHDKLPPMSQKDFLEVFNKAFDISPFVEFDITPLASASIGQVHKAILANGQTVAIKLRRKGIKEQVIADIRILNFFNTIFSPLFSFYTKNSIDALILEFSDMIKKEVSLKNELQNLLQFSKVYTKSGIKFPIAYEEFCSDDAIVMSFEEGFRFDDKQNLEKYNIDFRQIISKLIYFYTDQMLINGYFHADPHPGNLLINTSGELVLLDFGMVKSIPQDTRIAIIELIKSANEQDFDTYINANKKLGTISYDAPNDKLVEFSQKMFEIFSNDNLSSESMQKLAFEVLDSTRNLPFKLPSDAVYILRVSAMIEGLGTTYIENFNGVKDILPILQHNIPKALGANNSVVETLIDEIKSLPINIKHFKKVLQQASSGELSVQISKYQLEVIQKNLQEYAKPAILGLGCILFGIFILIYDDGLKNIGLIFGLFGLYKILWR